MEMYGIENKVNDIKTQEKQIKNQPVPKVTNEGVNTDTLTFEDLKQLIKQFKYIQTKISKLGELVITVDGDNLLYVAQRKYGLALQINNIDGWITKRITTKQQLEDKIDILKKLHKANDELLQYRKDLVV
jgi:hypothetical protein